MRKKNAFLFALMLLFPSLGNAVGTIENVIFDIDGVLLTTDKIAATKEIGAGIIMRYIQENRRSPSQEEVFSILEGVPARSKAIGWYNGRRLPQILVDWQTAEQTHDELAISIADCLLHRSDLKPSQKAFVAATVNIMLKPTVFVRTRKTIPDGVKLLKDVQARKLKTYLLSNWDKVSFPLIRTAFPIIFEGLQGFMISGDEKKLKPNREFFESFINANAIDPTKSIFIDDDQKNVEAAKALGFHAILCTGDYIQIAHQISELLDGIQSPTLAKEPALL